MSANGNNYGSELGRAVRGPYPVYTNIGIQPSELCTIPFSQVLGGQLAIVVQDNLAGGSNGQQVISNNIVACALVEVSIVGLIMGVEDTLTCVGMRSITGPLTFQFVDGLSFETISIRARMVRGGLPQLNPSAEPYSAGTEFSSKLGFAATLTVTINPRMEFATPPKRSC